MGYMKDVSVTNSEIEQLEGELSKARQYLAELNAKANELTANVLRLEGAIGYLRGKQEAKADGQE